MKKKTILILISVILLAAAVCTAAVLVLNNYGKNKEAPPQESESDSDTTKSESVTSGDMPSEPDTTETDSKLELNMELFSDFGKTYSKIASKRGKLTYVGTAEGGIQYCFENGYGIYNWNPETAGISYNSFEKGENGEIIVENAPIPTTDYPCYGIDWIKLETLFTNSYSEIKISDIKNIDSLEYIGTDEVDYIRKYMSIFSYKGIELKFFHDNEEKVDTNSRILIEIPTLVKGNLKNPDMDYCPHISAESQLKFDDKAMTLTGCNTDMELSSIRRMIEAENGHHKAFILKDGSEVDNGNIEEGMKIRIYHDYTFYGEYTVTALR